MLVRSLSEARQRLQELLREIVRRPEIQGDLAAELDQVFCALRNYAYFVDYQRKELAELCQEMDQL
jgi:hypothetical protein